MTSIRWTSGHCVRLRALGVGEAERDVHVRALQLPEDANLTIGKLTLDIEMTIAGGEIPTRAST